jgi:ketosteroid isomerase-like protein
MKFTIKLIVIIATLSMASVNKASPVTDEIDQQIWKPFIESWQTMDADKNIALHSSDIVRVMTRMKKIETGTDYFNQLKRMMGMMKEKGVTSKLDLRFSSRIQSADFAMEKGIYRATMNHPERGKTVNYAEFNVLLIKVNGSWKISFDQDIPSTEDAYNQLAD